MVYFKSMLVLLLICVSLGIMALTHSNYGFHAELFPSVDLFAGLAHIVEVKAQTEPT